VAFNLDQPRRPRGGDPGAAIPAHQDRADVQLAADRLRVEVRVLEPESRVARHHPDRGQLRESVDHGFGDALCEIFDRRIAGQIFKR
jgi:hypothetical protein